MINAMQMMIDYPRMRAFLSCVVIMVEHFSAVSLPLALSSVKLYLPLHVSISPFLSIFHPCTSLNESFGMHEAEMARARCLLHETLSPRVQSNLIKST